MTFSDLQGHIHLLQLVTFRTIMQQLTGLNPRYPLLTRVNHSIVEMSIAHIIMRYTKMSCLLTYFLYMLFG